MNMVSATAIRWIAEKLCHLLGRALSESFLSIVFHWSTHCHQDSESPFIKRGSEFRGGSVLTNCCFIIICYLEVSIKIFCSERCDLPTNIFFGSLLKILQFLFQIIYITCDSIQNIIEIGYFLWIQLNLHFWYLYIHMTCISSVFY